MEWSESVPMTVNQMLVDDITRLDYNLFPAGFQGDVQTVRAMQSSMKKLVDYLGEQSSAAQGLSRVITSADKLRACPDHTVYLLKDARAKGGAGEVIGMLKVGRKHLYLWEQGGGMLEVEPLCVLDFFVLDDRQRHGHGRRLFDHMLQDQQTTAHRLAVDGPSPKMEQFLRKNYNVAELLRQNNNFAVPPDFFNLHEGCEMSARVPPAVASAVGRFTAPKPPSAIATVIHGGGGGGGANGWLQLPARGRRRALALTPVPQTPHPPRPPLARPLQGDLYVDVKLCMLLVRRRERRAAPLCVGRSSKSASPDDWAHGHSASPSPPDHWEQRALQMVPRPSAPPASPPASPGARPRSLHVAPDAAAAAAPDAPVAPDADPSPAGSATSRRDSQLTNRGYFDVKFYHNKLW